MVIAGNLFLKPNEVKSIRRLKDALTVDNPQFIAQEKYATKYAKKVPEKICYLEVSGDTFIVPRNLPSVYFSEPIEVEDFRCSGSPVSGDFAFVGGLRDYQEYFHAHWYDFDLTDFVLEMDCGTGKTVYSLYLLSLYRLRTVIIVPTLFLAEQWRAAVEKFLPGVKCKVGSSDSDHLGADVYILNVDQLKAKKYAEKFYHSFGVLIMDEGHRYGASTYQPEIGLFNTLRRICLTATFYREDGLDHILNYHFGECITMENPFPPVTVVAIETDAVAKEEEMLHRGNVSFSKLDNWAAHNSVRNFQILKILTKLATSGRVVLFLSKRRESLEKWYDYYVGKGFKCALIVGGGTSKKTAYMLNYAKQEAQIIFGISQLAKEGLDIERLDTILLHHPVKDLKQASGRVRRIYAGKKSPLCVYPVDNVVPYRALYYASLKSIPGSIKRSMTTDQFLTSEFV